MLRMEAGGRGVPRMVAGQARRVAEERSADTAASERPLQHCWRVCGAIVGCFRTLREDGQCGRMLEHHGNIHGQVRRSRTIVAT